MEQYNQGGIPIEQRFKRDLKYISKELIAKQPNGNYCKYSTLLNAVSVINMPVEQYLGYWKAQYRSNEYSMKILEACKDLLTNKLTDTNTMINIIKNSKDDTDEKNKAIEYLEGKLV